VRRALQADRLAVAEDKPGRRRRPPYESPRASKPRISEEVRLAIVRRTAQEKPVNATHWSARLLAEEVSVGHTTVHVWKEHVPSNPSSPAMAPVTSAKFTFGPSGAVVL
jgi:hypothetical protein